MKSKWITSQSQCNFMLAHFTWYSARTFNLQTIGWSWTECATNDRHTHSNYTHFMEILDNSREMLHLYRLFMLFPFHAKLWHTSQLHFFCAVYEVSQQFSSRSPDSKSHFERRVNKMRKKYQEIKSKTF